MAYQIVDKLRTRLPMGGIGLTWRSFSAVMGTCLRKVPVLSFSAVMKELPLPPLLLLMPALRKVAMAGEMR